MNRNDKLNMLRHIYMHALQEHQMWEFFGVSDSAEYLYLQEHDPQIKTSLTDKDMLLLHIDMTIDGGVLVNKDITIDQDALMLKIGIIDLPANCVVVILEGKAKVRELPEHGEYRIVTHQGKVRRMRKEEGEEFWSSYY